MAKELDVSTTTIYRKLKKLDPGYIEKRGPITYITDEGVEAVKASLTDVKQVMNDVEEAINEVEQAPFNAVEQVESVVQHNADDEILYLREQYALLQNELFKSIDSNRELTEKVAAQADKIASQSDRLFSLTEQLAELVRNNQILLGAEQSRTLSNNEVKENRGLIGEEVQGEAVETSKKKRWRLFGFFARENG